MAHHDNSQTFTGKKRIRKSFGRIPEAVRMPNLIEVQRSSYEQFLQREVRPGHRNDEHLPFIGFVLACSHREFAAPFLISVTMFGAKNTRKIPATAQPKAPQEIWPDLAL